MRNEQTYLLVYLTETDGNINIHRGTKDNIVKLIEKHKLSNYDYAVIEGVIIPNFK